MVLRTARASSTLMSLNDLRRKTLKAFSASDCGLPFLLLRAMLWSSTSVKFSSLFWAIIFSWAAIWCWVRSASSIWLSKVAWSSFDQVCAPLSANSLLAAWLEAARRSRSAWMLILVSFKNESDIKKAAWKWRPGHRTRERQIGAISRKRLRLIWICWAARALRSGSGCSSFCSGALG